jgi:nucleotide-binding universal stress UspA family protein
MRSQEVMAMAQDLETGRLPHAPDRNNSGPPVIVVGLDGSPSSWDAFSWAAGEAARSKGRLVAVNVTPFTDAAASFGVPFDYAGVEETRREIADELKRDATGRANELGVALTFVSEHGDAAHCLTDVARRLHANFVVVGRSAKVFHHLAGSLSHRITSRNNAPVVVVVP